MRILKRLFGRKETLAEEPDFARRQELVKGHIKERGWPFAELTNWATFSTKRVVDEGAPILLMVHNRNGDWQALDGGEVTEENARVISLAAAFYLDPRIGEVADLPPGWMAEREDANAKWSRAKLS